MSRAAMNPQYIEEHHVLLRYLAGQLTDSEREAFEAYYVEHPQVLQDLEVAAKLKLGLSLLEDSGELGAPQRRYWLPRIAAAAALIAVILLGWWFARPSPPLLAASITAFGEHRQAPLLADTHTIERTRSRGFDAKLTLPATARLICLRVLPERPATTYELQMNLIDANATARVLGTLPDLRRDSSGLITMYLDSARLQPGSYEIVLAGSDTSATSSKASSFLIRIEPAG